MKKVLIHLSLVSVCLGSCQSSTEPISTPIATAPVSVVAPPPVVTTAKFSKFNHPDELRNAFSGNGLGELHPWHNVGGDSYQSITDDYEFGSPGATTLRNNMGYQLTGSEISHAQELELYLDIFNASERADALKRFQAAVEKTFQTLGIKKPATMFTALKTNKSFTQEEPNYTVKFYRDQSNVESWKLKITSK